MSDVSKLGPLWVKELIYKVQSTRNHTAENMLRLQPDGDYAKQHQMVLGVADAMLAATDLLAALHALSVAVDNLDPQSGVPIGYQALLDAATIADAAIAKATGVTQ